MVEYESEALGKLPV